MNDLYFKHIFFNSIAYSVNHNEYNILVLLILIINNDNYVCILLN